MHNPQCIHVYYSIGHLKGQCSHLKLAYYYYYYYTTTVLRPFVQDYPGESVPEGKTILDFAEAKMMWVAVASAEPYASYLHFAPAR